MSVSIQSHAVAMANESHQGAVAEGHPTVSLGVQQGGAAQLERSWGQILEDTARIVSRSVSPRSGTTRKSATGLENMTDLLKLQQEVSGYQLRIECASKVCESFTASLRKLQQQQ
jgi:hypothetical protein